MRRFFAILILLAATVSGWPQTAPPGWVRYSPADGGFTVLLPTTPQPTEDRKTYTNGDVVTHIFLAKTADDFLCVVGYTDYPMDFNADKELILDRDNFVKEVNGTVSTTQRTTFPGASGEQLPALQFVATSAAGTFKGTVVIAARRAYIAVAFNRKDSDRGADVERFLASFKLKK